MLRVVKSLDDLAKVHAVRAIVFCEEQGVAYDIELDDDDHCALHILGELEGEPVAAGRIRFLGEFAKFERLAIRKAYRGKGYGNQLLHYMLGIAREQGFSKIKLNAQVASAKFYAKHGFVIKGEEFIEANIPHCLMLKED